MKTKAQLAGLAMAVLLTMNGETASASCGQAACSIDTRIETAELPGARMLRLDTSVEYIEQDQPWVRHHDAEVGEIQRDHHNEVETTNVTWKLGFEATVTSRWSVGFVLPVVHREHLHLAAHEDSTAELVSPTVASRPLPRHADHGGTGSQDDEHETGDGDEITIGDATGVPERWDFTRIGDAQATVAYSILRPDVDAGIFLQAYAGLKLPTGETGVRNDDGEMAEITLQPGTGSVDPVLGVVGGYGVPLSEGRELPISGGIHLRTEGSDGKYGYRPGTEMVLSGGAEYPVTGNLDLLGQLNFRYRDRDHVSGAPGVEAEHTGGEALYLSPGVRLSLGEAFRAFTYVQVPVYQRVNGIQLVSEWNLLFGVNYQLNL